MLFLKHRQGKHERAPSGVGACRVASRQQGGDWRLLARQQRSRCEAVLASAAVLACDGRLVVARVALLVAGVAMFEPAAAQALVWAVPNQKGTVNGRKVATLLAMAFWFTSVFAFCV